VWNEELWFAELCVEDFEGGRGFEVDVLA